MKAKFLFLLLMVAAAEALPDEIQNFHRRLTRYQNPALVESGTFSRITATAWEEYPPGDLATAVEDHLRLLMRADPENQTYHACTTRTICVRFLKARKQWNGEMERLLVKMLGWQSTIMSGLRPEYREEALQILRQQTPISAESTMAVLASVDKGLRPYRIASIEFLVDQAETDHRTREILQRTTSRELLADVLGKVRASLQKRINRHAAGESEVESFRRTERLYQRLGLEVLSEERFPNPLNEESLEVLRRSGTERDKVPDSDLIEALERLAGEPSLSEEDLQTALVLTNDRANPTSPVSIAARQCLIAQASYRLLAQAQNDPLSELPSCVLTILGLSEQPAKRARRRPSKP